MKVLNLKFKNINSLAGEHEIDFTKSIFTYEGLFVITGKTGAGKSSILDAVSLALYGKTPRVEITGNENAVMTRGEKDCYAEIVFEVAGRKWKASWKQERSRTGNLKAVNRLLADESNHILADQVRTCDVKIVEILGLTFEQFTKVIMLAQGSFAAFLQADKNDKGELLEQITGTELYGRISKEVFERTRAEKEKLTQIEAALQSIHLLPEEEIARLRDQVVLLEKNKKALDADLQQVEKAMKWVVDVETLQKQIEEVRLKLPELEQKESHAHEVFEQALKNVADRKQELEIQEPTFRKVSELDTKIAEKRNSLNPLLTVIENGKKEQAELMQTIEKQEQKLKEAQTLLNEKQRWAVEHQKVESLVTQYSAIEQESQLLEKEFHEIERQKEEANELQLKVSHLKAALEKAKTSFETAKHNWIDKKEGLAQKQTERDQLLDGQEWTEYQTKKEELVAFSALINQLTKLQEAMDKNNEELAELEVKIAQCDSESKALSERIENDKRTEVQWKQQMTLLEENIQLTKTIQSLDEHRRQLKDGEVCPLCGSTEHPFARGNVPQMGEKEKELTRLKKQWQELIKTIQENEIRRAGFLLDKENAVKNRQKEVTNKAANEQNKKDILFKLIPFSPDFGKADLEIGPAHLLEMNRDIQQKIDQIEKKINDASHLEKEIRQLRDVEIPLLQRAEQEAEATRTKAETDYKLAEQQQQTHHLALQAHQQKVDAAQEAFLAKLQQYDAKNIETLKQYVEEWLENEKQISLLSEHILNIKQDISLRHNTLDNMIKSIEEKDAEKKEIEAALQQLRAERFRLFGEKSRDEEETQLKRAIQAAEEAQEHAQKERLQWHTELEKQKAVLIDKEQERDAKLKEPLTDKTYDDLVAERTQMNAASEEMSQTLGATHQKLTANDELWKSSLDKRQAKEKQEQVCRQWSALNDLIGSADGKKYRNFAQALTFEHLVSLSNRHLQKMSERYLLKRTGDASNPFELSVIDKFQNSEERTAQNLSGGEKFIVSLSLALGLSHMAGKNMRIDMMFIDEGFGTLDTDYLDVALSALSNLRSEGKMIGVISHLTELKERIATHIEVVPAGNGHSTIQLIG
jgi:exonuclease SbcC